MFSQHSHRKRGNLIIISSTGEKCKLSYIFVGEADLIRAIRKSFLRK